MTVARYNFLGRGGDLGDIPDPLGVDDGGGEVASQQVRERRLGLVLPGQPVAAFDFSRDQTLPAHRVSDRLLAHLPALLAKVDEQPGDPVQATASTELLRDRGVDLGLAAGPT